MDCKAALEAAKGEVEGAVEHLRKKGLADAAKKQHREARDGLIHAYIHQTGKMGVLIEVDCETDFVARTPDFQQLVKDLAVQVAALPTTTYISREQVPGAVVEKEREIYREQMADQNKAIGDANINCAAATFAAFARPCGDDLCRHPSLRGKDQRASDGQVQRDGQNNAEARHGTIA